MDDSKLATVPLRLRYQVHRGTREIFRTRKRGIDEFDVIRASAAYMAVGGPRDNLAPEFVGCCEKQASDHKPDPGLNAIIIALEHALQTIHRALRDEPRGFHVYIGIYSDQINGLRLIRKAVENEGLEYYVTRSGSPRLYHTLLKKAFTLHQKINYLVGPQGVKIEYRFMGGNVRPLFDQKVVVTKCKAILDQMQEEYYASRRWNQVSRFLQPYDCHGWLKGNCHHAPEKCLYQHRIKMWGTGIPPRHQSNADAAPVREMPTCKYWAQGKCFNGDACKFAHDGVGGILERPVCVYWKQGQCFNGDACEFRHEETMTDHEPQCNEVS